MKILKINTTGGPNFWSVRRLKLVVMQLDLEELESQPTNRINGFYQGIKKVFPGLYEHHCSEGKPGGFLSRVKRGTWMGHVIEHIALELQVLAGLEVGFGRTRGIGIEGQYHVVFECVDRETGRRTAELAVAIARDLINGKKFDLDADVEEIREMSLRFKPGPSTGSLLDEAAARNIPAIKLEQGSTYQLGYGCNQKKIAATIVSSTSNLAVDTADDKQACRRLFKEMLIPVADGGVAYYREELDELVDEIGFPLVIKPVSGNQGRGVTTNIQSSGEALEAYDNALDISNSVIVERHIPGYDFRLLVVNYTLAAAAQRTPAHVRGDGKSSIKDLIEAVNNSPSRGEGHDKVLTKIEIGQSAKAILENKEYTLGTILPEGEILYLDHAANLSKGGTAEDVTDTLHAKVVALAERISKVVGLDICGIDMMASTLAQPLSATGGVVLEVNAAPGFRMHLSPSKGKTRNVAVPVLDMLFPKESKNRIPIIAVTGTNGKTTTTRLITHIMKGAERRVGYTTTDGIYVDDEQMMKGDCGGPKSAEFVLRDPTVDTAVLECARGGILREGLGFDRCDVAVVTNVSSDHLGLKGINTLEKMARVKSVVPESVHPGGYAVLNADDDLVYAMRENLNCNVVLFSVDPDSLRLLAHRETGGVCVTCQDKSITIWDGNETHTVEKIEDIPLSFGGRAGFMIENILAAAAAAYTQAITPVEIGKSLISFSPSPTQTPGRMNLFSFGNYDVMIDYAHNAAGLLAIKDFLGHSSYQHTMGIVASMGDRREEDNLEMGRIAAEIFDTVIIREDADLRGRAPGETIEIIKRGIASSEHNPKVIAIADEKKALAYAMKNALPGSLILHCTEKVEDVLAFVKQRKANHKKSKPTALKSAPAH